MRLKCVKLSDTHIHERFLKSDKNGRAVSHFKLNDVYCVGSNMLYPNVKLFATKEQIVFEPLEEEIMSLKKIAKNIEVEVEVDVTYTQNLIVVNPVFYFVYNTDNYFHFLYDTLPHIISYMHIRKTIPHLKLLMSYPNESKKEAFQFVIETLELFKIYKKDVLYIRKNTLYSEIHISSSYTHGINSNLAPRKEVYDLYDSIFVKSDQQYPEKVYVSRRSWLHGDYTNIGTNYTSRRKMMNEDELVFRLEKEGFIEVFTENMSMKDKISMFRFANKIVGPIGGGMTNILFSKKPVVVVPILSPTFLDVNKRFSFCFKDLDVKYANKSIHYENDVLKKYMRVETIDGKVGEITNIDKNLITINYTDVTVAGWSNSVTFKTATFDRADVTQIDHGLNSEWVSNIDEVIECLA